MSSPIHRILAVPHTNFIYPHTSKPTPCLVPFPPLHPKVISFANSPLLPLTTASLHLTITITPILQLLNHDLCSLPSSVLRVFNPLCFFFFSSILCFSVGLGFGDVVGAPVEEGGGAAEVECGEEEDGDEEEPHEEDRKSVV